MSNPPKTAIWFVVKTIPKAGTATFLDTGSGKPRRRKSNSPTPDPEGYAVRKCCLPPLHKFSRFVSGSRPHFQVFVDISLQFSNYNSHFKHRLLLIHKFPYSPNQNQVRLRFIYDCWNLYLDICFKWKNDYLCNKIICDALRDKRLRFGIKTFYRVCVSKEADTLYFLAGWTFCRMKSV